MCILQLVLTTARPPASSADTMGPAAGSFSMRSLTSCVAKERMGVTALPLSTGQQSQDRGGDRGFGPGPNPGTLHPAQK